MIRSHLEVDNLSQNWDAIVIGAGPAGSMAAFQMASHGCKTLLIDKANFPRSKVCGCCLNSAAVDALTRHGLGNIIRQPASIALHSIKLMDDQLTATIALQGGVSISRARLDAELIEQAMHRGAQFLPGHTCQVAAVSPESAKVEVIGDEQKRVLQAKIVIVADGLSGRSLMGQPRFTINTSPSSRFGAGVVLDQAPAFYRPGQIYMCCSDGGYVGLVLLENGKLDVAAAFDKAYCRRHSGPATAAAAIIDRCGLPLPPQIEDAHWSGTDAMTRSRRHVAGTRVFVIGDASGYAEPFTGEGIAWALWSAIAVCPLAVAAIQQWDEGLVGKWESIFHNFIGRQHSRSRLIAALLRQRILRRGVISLLAAVPNLAMPLAEQAVGKYALPPSTIDRDKEPAWQS